jgi:hypothetical protein
LIFQKQPSRCACALCDEGCLCGDCSKCTNGVYDAAFARSAKRLSVIACVVVLLGAFMFFAPVVSLGSEIPVTAGVPALRIQTSETSTAELCSITFCYLGSGAVYANGTYYPVTNPLVGLAGPRK